MELCYLVFTVVDPAIYRLLKKNETSKGGKVRCWGVGDVAEKVI